MTNPIIFNFYPQPHLKGNATFLVNDDPVVQFDEVDVRPRHERQLTGCQKHSLNLGDQGSIFGPDLEWAYRGYILQRLSSTPAPAGETDSASGSRTAPPGMDSPPVLGTAPSQPVDASARIKALANIKPQDVRRPRGSAATVDLYLFNVLVALEWTPTREDLEELQWAFRRASDFLYDVTDGCMAFGQVVFGGLELMGCADIQIMASSRLFPRSWLKGLIDPNTYIPIRVGRGLWHRRNQVVIPWDEPESYRTLIHEWAHYAFGLLDEYVTESEDKKRVVPSIRLPSTSIMATLEGTSELVAHANRGRNANTDKEWKDIRKIYGGLKAMRQPLVGPGRLPLPLPVFHYTGEFKNIRQGSGSTPDVRLNIKEFLQGIKNAPDTSNPKFPFDRCWVYVLRSNNPDELHRWLTHPSNNDMAALPEGTRLIAQGTLDARYEDGYRLLGADNNDTVILTYLPGNSQPRTWGGKVSNNKVGEAQEFGGDWPLIDVVPYVEPNQASAASGHGRKGRYRVRIADKKQDVPAMWVFPLGQTSAPFAVELKRSLPELVKEYGVNEHEDRLSDLQENLILDGHVFGRLRKGGFTICPFSQGGGPPGHPTVPANPITAGSSDGNVLLFFNNSETADDGRYRDIRVTTTLSFDPDWRSATGSNQIGYTYSVASNAQLPCEFQPTLVIYYDPFAIRLGEHPVLEWWKEDKQNWIKLEGAEVRPDGAFVAIALCDLEGNALTSDSTPTVRAARFRLAWRQEQAKNLLTPAGGSSEPSSQADGDERTAESSPLP